MNLLGRKKDNADSGDESGNADDVDVTVDAGDDAGARTTAPKGRPTPKQSANRKRGPVAPAPMTTAEARKRRKELRNSKSKEERKADRVARRADMDARRAKMMAGDEAYLLPRDKGPVKRYVRDLVDSRRNVLGLFMPSALVLVFFITSGGGAQSMCDKLKDGTFSAAYNYDAVGIGRDAWTAIMVALQNKKGGGAIKTQMYSPYRYMTKEDVKDGTCFNPEEYAKILR